MPSSRDYLIVISLSAAALVCASMALRISKTEMTAKTPRMTDKVISYSSTRPDPSFWSEMRDEDNMVGRENSDHSQVLSDERRQPVVEIRVAGEPTARAYLVGNAETGKIYFEKDAQEVLPVASMSKLITAMTALNTYSPTTTIEITKANSKYYPDSSNLLPGERFSMEELLYPMLMNSSNVAAEAIASAAGRTGFLESMSSYAWEIGMPASYFADPSGIDPLNMASARDIFSLARYLFIRSPEILSITRVLHTAIATTSEHGAHNFDNIHPLSSDPGFIGGKTGRTPEAGETMLTIMNVNDKPVVFIVLGSNVGNREADTRLLIKRYKNGIW